MEHAGCAAASRRDLNESLSQTLTRELIVRDQKVIQSSRIYEHAPRHVVKDTLDRLGAFLNLNGEFLCVAAGVT